METLRKTTETNGIKRILRLCTVALSLTVFLTINIFAEPGAAENALPASQNSNNTDSTRLHQTWNGTAWVDAVVEDDSKALAEAKKKNEHDTFMRYIYMGLGFLAIISIALFSAFKKEKKGGGATKENPPHALKPVHSSSDKKYGGHKPRR